MHTFTYGKKHFKHSANFKDMVVFSDTTQNRIKDVSAPSPNTFIQVIKDATNPDTWFIDFTAQLSGEYADFYLDHNLSPTGYIANFNYAITEANTTFIQDYSMDFQDGKVPYYTIQNQQYIKLNGSIDLDAVTLNYTPKLKANTPSDDAYDAFVSVFISANGAKLERAYQKVTNIQAREIAIFIETDAGTNAFGSVFRVRKGSQVKTLMEANRSRIATIAKAYGVDVRSVDFTDILKAELAQQDNAFYILHTPFNLGTSVLRWGADVTLTGIADAIAGISSSINDLKLGAQYYKVPERGSQAKFTPILPALSELTEDALSALPQHLYTQYIAPLAEQATAFTTIVLQSELLQGLLPVNLKPILKVLAQIPNLFKQFFAALGGVIVDLYYFVNGLLVGLINSIIDAIKSIFDILGMLVSVLNKLMQSTTFFNAPGSYLSVFAESIENVVDAFVNSFTLNNLTLFIGTLARLPKQAYSAIIAGVNKAKDAIRADVLGYGLGVVLGVVITEVVTFFATGGTGNIAKAVKEVFSTYANLAKQTAKYTAKAAQFGIDTMVRASEAILTFSKNIPKYLKQLQQWFNEFLAGVKQTASNVFKKFNAVMALLYDLGVVIVDDLIRPLTPQPELVLVNAPSFKVNRNGDTIYQGTQKAIEDFLNKIDDISKSGGNAKKKVEKHLDEVSEASEKVKLRKDALVKWANKFEQKFHLHFDGEIVVKKFSKRDGTPALWLVGAHNHLVNGKAINIKTIHKPSGVKYKDLLDDVPFIANVEKIYSNRFIPKKRISSFFPKNWDIIRIKEEIAYVYDDLIKTGKDLSIPPLKYTSMNSEETFEILIEFDKFGNITNAYPSIKI